ncbi:MAG: hypothetical protein QM754_05550 [Tepidisphaeraceae bacterium]
MTPEMTGRVSPQERGVWYFLHALGRGALPDSVEVAGRTLRVSRFIKHDFFAATGFYDDAETGERYVVKIARTESLLGLPMRWLGRMINRREMRFYGRLSDLPNVPAVLGPVGNTGFAHAYVAGRPLEKDLPIPDGFFDELLTLVDRLAERGIAIVDTNKRENIILGNDGRPHLIDFQISYDTRDLFDLWPAGPILRMFYRTDRYHILKHKVRLRPDLATEADRHIVNHRNVIIRLHRTLTRPYFLIRRRLFSHLRRRGN